MRGMPKLGRRVSGAKSTRAPERKPGIVSVFPVTKRLLKGERGHPCLFGRLLIRMLLTLFDAVFRLDQRYPFSLPPSPENGGNYRPRYHRAERDQ